MKKDFNYKVLNYLNKAYTKIQIYWNNKNGYKFEVLADLKNKSIIFKADNVIIENKNFNKFSHFEEYLENKNVEFFKREYSDKKITNKIASLVINGDINLTVLSADEQNTYIYFLYKYILYNFYNDKDTVNYKIIDLFDDEFVTVENQTTDEILKEIRDDVLEQIKKDINIWLFNDMYYL